MSIARAGPATSSGSGQWLRGTRADASACVTLATPAPARRDRGQDRNAERRLETREVEPDPARLGLVVHVEHEHGPDLELRELRREQERAAQVLGVGHLHHDRTLVAAHGAHAAPS